MNVPGMNGQRDFEALSTLVTGATSGIGRAAEELGRHGAEIVVHGRDADRGSVVAGAITAEGGKARFVGADLADPAQVGATTLLGRPARPGEIANVPSSFMITLAAGTKLTCTQAAARLLTGTRCWEVRSAGHGSKGQRWYAWAWIATARDVQALLSDSCATASGTLRPLTRRLLRSGGYCTESAADSKRSGIGLLLCLVAGCQPKSLPLPFTPGKGVQMPVWRSPTSPRIARPSRRTSTATPDA